MKRAAIGVRMHSGWGALVAVSNNDGAAEILARRRIVVTAAQARGGNQPYHFAKTLELPEAEKYLADSFAASKHLAREAVRDLISELHGQHRVVGCAVLLASGRPLPSLAKILAAHPLIHTAEGEFFRQTFSKACESLDLPVTGLRERDLDECLQTSFGEAATEMRQQVSTLGQSLGPPWTTDQKMAALAALVILANKQGVWD
jgi:hypothetical protein